MIKISESKLILVNSLFFSSCLPTSFKDLQLWDLKLGCSPLNDELIHPCLLHRTYYPCIFILGFFLYLELLS